MKDFVWSCVSVIIFLVVITLLFSVLSSCTTVSKVKDLERHEKKMIEACMCE